MVTTRPRPYPAVTVAERHFRPQHVLGCHIDAEALPSLEYVWSHEVRRSRRCSQKRLGRSGEQIVPCADDRVGRTFLCSCAACLTNASGPDSSMWLVHSVGRVKLATFSQALLGLQL